MVGHVVQIRRLHIELIVALGRCSTRPGGFRPAVRDACRATTGSGRSCLAHSRSSSRAAVHPDGSVTSGQAHRRWCHGCRRASIAACPARCRTAIGDVGRVLRHLKGAIRTRCHFGVHRQRLRLSPPGGPDGYVISGVGVGPVRHVRSSQWFRQITRGESGVNGGSVEGCGRSGSGVWVMWVSSPSQSLADLLRCRSSASGRCGGAGHRRRAFVAFVPARSGLPRALPVVCAYHSGALPTDPARGQHLDLGRPAG